MTTSAVTMAELGTYLAREMQQRSLSSRAAGSLWGVDKDLLNRIIKSAPSDADWAPPLYALQRIAVGLEMPDTDPKKIAARLRRLIELAGFSLGDDIDPTLLDMTDEERAAYVRLSPAKRRAFLQMLLQLDDDPPEA